MGLEEGSTKCPALPKCTAGFSSNYIHTLSNSVTGGCTKCETLPNYEDNTPVRETGRKPRRLEVEVGFSHYLTLNWINVSKLRLRLMLN